MTFDEQLRELDRKLLTGLAAVVMNRHRPPKWRKAKRARFDTDLERLMGVVTSRGSHWAEAITARDETTKWQRPVPTPDTTELQWKVTYIDGPLGGTTERRPKPLDAAAGYHYTGGITDAGERQWIWWPDDPADRPKCYCAGVRCIEDHDPTRTPTTNRPHTITPGDKTIPPGDTHWRQQP